MKVVGSTETKMVLAHSPGVMEIVTLVIGKITTTMDMVY
jgi:hypothetical protein